jgi:hypothetical protein
MEHVPFSIINQYLKGKLLHPSRYCGSKFSFLKIFQHGLYYHFTKQEYKIIFNYLQFPIWFQKLVYQVKARIHRKQKKTYLLHEYVILVPDRAVLNPSGKWHSIYFDRIAELIGKERVTTINQIDSCAIKSDFSVSDFSGVYPALDETELDVLKEVKLTLQVARRSMQFSKSELKQIRSAMHIFFEEFRLYYNLLKGQPTQKVLLICHYHNEGLIAASQVLGIETIEFQHGLIASNDIYYIYHEQFASVIGHGFFPDKILVYGPYWKRILENGCEYHSPIIHVAGDYLYRLEKEKLDSVEKENIVLVCAQKNLHDDYIGYVTHLLRHAAKHPEWKIVIKLHPQEKNKEAYYPLAEAGVDIRDTETPLDMLLKRCKIHISIYSTTFYDALGFDVCNFSLQQYGTMSDYAADMISEAVALPLYLEEDPIEKYYSVKSQNITLTPREEVYSSFDSAEIQRAIGLNGVNN